MRPATLFPSSPRPSFPRPSFPRPAFPRPAFPRPAFLCLFFLCFLFAACSGRGGLSDAQHAAFAQWKNAYDDAESEREKLGLLDEQIFNEGPQRKLLDQYEAALSSVEELLLNAIFAAELVAFVGGKNSMAPLAATLGRYSQITEKCRFVGNRFQRKGLSLKAQEMAQTIEDVCRNVSGTKSGFAACK